MKIVVHGNRVIAALIKDSTTRDIIFDTFFELFTPDFILTEIRKYEDEIIKKARITKDEFEILLTIIFENITIIDKTEYENII
ncbi:MAG: PIN domain-containing protein, partial [Nanoarchaeota archaeon]